MMEVAALELVRVVRSKVAYGETVHAPPLKMGVLSRDISPGWGRGNKVDPNGESRDLGYLNLGENTQEHQHHSAFRNIPRNTTQGQTYIVHTL
jgi:hypothetical protein